MTTDDARAFDAGMIALAAVTGKALDALVKRAYWTALEDIPGPVVVAALRLAMGSAEFFPSAAEIRRLCDEADGEGFVLAPEVLALPPGEIVETYQGIIDSEQATAWCGTCLDSGFAHYLCEPGNRCTWSELCRKQVLIAGDANVAAHTYVKKCDCIQSNPVIKRRMERMRESMNIGKYFKPRGRAKVQRSFSPGE